MTLENFKFVSDPGTSESPNFASPLNIAFRDILAKLRVATDLNDEPLLVSATRGIDHVMKDVLSGANPSPDECPCVRALGGHHEYEVKTVNFYTLDGYSAIHLYFIFYGPDTENFESLRDDHIRRCLKYLQPSEQDINDDNGLDTDATIWQFSKQGNSYKAVIDHDTPLRFFGQNVTTGNGYFVSRVDLPIEWNDFQGDE